MSSSDSGKLKVKSEARSPKTPSPTASASSASSKAKKSNKKEKKKSKPYSLNKDDIRYLTANTRYDEREIRWSKTTLSNYSVV